MLGVDHTITLRDVPVDDEWEIYGHTFALAQAAYKLHLLEHIKMHDEGGWKLSSEKYRILKDQGDSWPKLRYETLRRRFGLIKIDKRDFDAKIDHHRKWVGKQVLPLLVDHLDRDETILSPENAKRKDQGLTCVKITDDDLPWKDIPW